MILLALNCGSSWVLNKSSDWVTDYAINLKTQKTERDVFTQ